MSTRMNALDEFFEDYVDRIKGAKKAFDEAAKPKIEEPKTEKRIALLLLVEECRSAGVPWEQIRQGLGYNSTQVAFNWASKTRKSLEAQGHIGPVGGS